MRRNQPVTTPRLWRWMGVWLLCWLMTLSVSTTAAEYRPLPPSAKNGLSADWLIYNAARNRLTLYLPGYHTPAHAYYQWVNLRPGRALPITFVARQDECLFLDNQLIFKSPAAASYTLDLATFLPPAAPAGQHLLCVWHADVAPNLSAFANASSEVAATTGKSASPGARVLPRPRGHQGQTVFIGFLLLIGLLYGGLRASYQPGFARIYQFEQLWRRGNNEPDFLVKPTITWLNILLVLIFSLSFALLLVAIHTNIQSIVILRRLFAVPESAIVLRVLFYTSLIAAFILGKYIFLELMGYIFDVTALVIVQYREFIRTILFMGLFLPLVMLLYLGLNQSLPETVLWVSNGVVSLLLLGSVFRIARTLHRRTSLLNLHLFSYLCATEVIPLIILLKIIVFTY